jgi:hypothetical protein
VLKAETTIPATPLASPEEQNPETDRRIAIISSLNILVDAPQRENPRSQFPWSYAGPPDALLSTMKSVWTSPGLPKDAAELVQWCQSNYRALRAAGLLVSFPKHPQSGPGRERPDLIRVERADAENPDQYIPLIDGVRR